MGLTWEQQAAQAADNYVKTEFPNALEVTHAQTWVAGAKWEAERSALLVKALEKITKYCPAEELHGTEDDCHVYGCKEGREALRKYREG